MWNLRLLLALLPLFFLVPVAGWSQTAIVGRVLSEGEPVPSARVVVKGTTWRAVSDESGTYRIEGLGVGRYTLFASAAGRSTEERTITLGEGEILRLDFRLGEATAVALNPLAVSALPEREGAGWILPLRGPEERMEIPARLRGVLVAPGGWDTVGRVRALEVDVPVRHP